MDKAIAVIDIGMTNKKVSVYDRQLRMLDSASRTFAPCMVQGLETHDLLGMEAWFLQTLSRMAEKHRLGAIAVTTHGATMVLVGENGLPCAPCVYYTHEPGADFQNRFYTEMGDRESLQARTGTPPLSAMINPSKGLFFLREHFPEAYAKAKWVLSYPQYWGYRLCGKLGAEGTYAGCHTYLWDWQTEAYSSVAKKLGIADKLPFPLRDSWSVLGELKSELAHDYRLPADAVVTMGIHDSNASLLPHLAKKAGRDFILNSTGTWCVLMHPQDHFGFSREELGKVVFFNRSAYNRPVKTAIFLGGMEYEAWTTAIAARLGLEPSRLPEAPADDYISVIESSSEFILPELVPGSGQFPGSASRAVQNSREFLLEDIRKVSEAPAFFADARRAIAVLNLSLALQTLVALERSGLGERTEVFTEGGFRKNQGYNALIATALGQRVFLTDIAEATSLGAAMTALSALEDRTPDSLGGLFEIDYKAVSPLEGLKADKLLAYRKAWLAALEGGRT